LKRGIIQRKLRKLMQEAQADQDNGSRLL
jgi:hypothetical protein